MSGLSVTVLAPPAPRLLLSAVKVIAVTCDDPLRLRAARARKAGRGPQQPASLGDAVEASTDASLFRSATCEGDPRITYTAPSGIATGASPGETPDVPKLIDRSPGVRRRSTCKRRASP